MLTKDQYFEQYWPTSSYYQSFQTWKGQKVFDGNKYRDPTPGEIAWQESNFRNAAKTLAVSGFNKAWETFNTQQQAAVEALKQQEAAAGAAAAAQEQTKAATLVAKKSSALALSQQQQAMVREAQEASTTGRVAQRQTTRTSAKTSIGQPGVSRTRVSARGGIGGYSGTTPGNVNPTGLNI
jgi:hypothetical protein